VWLIVAAAVATILGISSSAQAQVCDWTYTCTTGEDCILCDNGEVCGTYGSDRCMAGRCEPPIPDGSAGCHEGGESCSAGAECQSGICQSDTQTCAPAGMAHIVEVQLDTSDQALRNLVTAVARGLQHDQVCGEQTITCPFGYASQTGLCVVDRISAPAPGANLSLRYGDTLQTLPNYDVQFYPVQGVLPVEVVIRDAQCLQDPNVPCNPQTYNLDVILAMQAQLGSEGLQICGSVAQVMLGGLDLAGIIQLPPQECIPLSPITKSLADIGAAIHDIQVSANVVDGAPGNRLAVRIWFESDPHGNVAFGAPYLADNYRTFFNGMIAPSPPGTSWSMFFGYQAMQNVAQGAVYSLTSGALKGRSAGWAPASRTFDASFQDIVLGSVCNVEVKLFTTSSFGLDQATQQTTLDFSLDADVALSGCIFTFVNPIIDGLVNYMVNGWDLGTLGLPLFQGAGECTFNLDSLPFTAHCVGPSVLPPTTPIPGGPTLGASITQVVGATNGLMVGGSFSASSLGPEPNAKAEAEPFTYSWNGSCSAPKLGWMSILSVDGVGELCGPPEVVDDPLGICSVEDPDPGNTTLPKYFIVHYAWDQPSYPCHVVVRTTGGSTMVTIDAPPGPPSFEDVVGGWIGVYAACNPIPSPAPVHWDPHWSVDPPWDPEAVLSIGEDRIRGVLQIVGSKLVTIGPVQRLRSDLGSVQLYKQAVRLEATALVKSERVETFAVPLSVELVASFEGREDDRVGPRFVELELAEDIRQRVHVDSASLPRGVDALDFALSVERDAATFFGALPVENLAASWVLDETDGEKALDVSGHENMCELVNDPQVVAGVRGNARLFQSGAVAVCSDAESLSPREQMSISAWFNSATVDRSQTIVGKETDDASVQYSLRLQSGGLLQFEVGGVRLDGSTRISTNVWHHVVATYDGANVQLYLDGALEASIKEAVRLEHVPVEVCIGARKSERDPLPFSGIIDEVRVYDRALTREEAASPYW
jgi:hypothetical protein